MTKNDVQSVSLKNYSARESAIHKSSKNHKISPDTNLCKQNKTKIHKYQTQIFRRISPFGIASVKKAHKARTRWYHGPFRQLVNTRFSKSTKKNEWTEAFFLKFYKCTTANTSVIWQHAAHTTDQLSSPDCSAGAI